MNIIVITGASSGMGREFALQLDKGLFSVDEFWLIARRKERLEALAGQLDHPAKILPLDLERPEDIQRFQDMLQKERSVIRMLINCAGYGLMGAFETLDSNGQSGMVDLNCRTLVQMTHVCLPYMKRKSRIIQLASSAAFLPQADFAVYAATKSFVLSFSMALGQELKERQIYVTAVCPGPVRTEFFDRAEQFGTTLAVKKLIMVEADRVVQDALKASARHQSTAVTGLPLKALQIASKALPHKLMLEGAGVLKKLQ